MTDVQAPTTETTGAGPSAATKADVSGRTRATKGAADRLKALAHPVRLRMVELLADGGGELCVCHFEEVFDLAQPTISHHLKRLRDAGLVDSRKDGTWVHHRLRREAVARLAGLLDRWSGGATAEEDCCGSGAPAG